MQPAFMAGAVRCMILRMSASEPSETRSRVVRARASSTESPKAMNGLNA